MQRRVAGMTLDTNEFAAFASRLSPTISLEFEFSSAAAIQQDYAPMLEGMVLKRFMSMNRAGRGRLIACI